MTNQELISKLSELPPDAEITLFWDGAARGDVEGIVCRDGEIVLVGEWSIYRDGDYRKYPEECIVFG